MLVKSILINNIKRKTEMWKEGKVIEVSDDSNTFNYRTNFGGRAN